MIKFTSREIKEFVSKPLFNEKVILNKDPSYPKIFIVIPVHNRKELTRLCLESLRGQDYQGFKVLVFDGGSTDETMDIIKSFEGTYNMRWLSAKDEGQYDAINKGS